MKRRFSRLAAAATAAAALAVVAACSSGGSSTGGAASGGSSSGPVTITFWTWLSTTSTQKIADQFTAAHPNIKVKVVNAGQSAAEYTKLDTVIKAGKGAPDIAQIEYFALPQYVLSNDVVNLSQTSASSVIKSSYTASAVDGVTVNGSIYAYPQDIGPMAMFYNTKVFKEAGLTPPTTWAQYAADAATIHKKLPKTYIGNVDPGDPGTATSLMWQAGATPFQTTGSTNVSVDFNQSGVQQWATLWSGLLEKKLVTNVPGWTTSWWAGMNSGEYATWVTGAWAPAPMTGEVNAADWAVAPIPQWTAGANVDASNGGSSSAILASSPNKAQAQEFLNWMDASEAGQTQLASLGLFPSNSSLLASSTWLHQPVKMLDNSQANMTLAQAATQVKSGWQYLPYQVYANSVYADTVGQDITANKSLMPGLQAWEQRLVSYGNSEGFTVKAGS